MLRNFVRLKRVSVGTNSAMTQNSSTTTILELASMKARQALMWMILVIIAMSIPEFSFANLDLRVLREEKEVVENNRFQSAPGLLELQPEIIYLYDPPTKRNALIRVEIAVLLQETDISFRELELRAEILAPVTKALQFHSLGEIVGAGGEEKVISLVFDAFEEAYPELIVENVELIALVVQNDEIFPSG